MKKFCLILTLFLMQSPCFCSHLHQEKEYQNYWCKMNKGQTEFMLNDKTRVDCITSQYAIEFDFAQKWAESIGQSLYYSINTGKLPGVVLIIENPQKDIKYYRRLNKVAEKYNIKVWTICPQNLGSESNCSFFLSK